MMPVMTRRDRQSQVWLYFIRNTRSGSFKIGYSGDPEGRRSDLQVGNEDRLEIEVQVPGWSKPEEIRLHAQYEALQFAGEWHRPDPRLTAFISQLKEELKTRPPALCSSCGHGFYLRLAGFRVTPTDDNTHEEMCPICRRKETTLQCEFCSAQPLSGTSRVFTYLGGGACICVDCRPLDDRD